MSQLLNYFQREQPLVWVVFFFAYINAHYLNTKCSQGVSIKRGSHHVHIPLTSKSVNYAFVVR